MRVSSIHLLLRVESIIKAAMGLQPSVLNIDCSSVASVNFSWLLVGQEPNFCEIFQTVDRVWGRNFTLGSRNKAPVSDLRGRR